MLCYLLVKFEIVDGFPFAGNSSWNLNKPLCVFYLRPTIYFGYVVESLCKLIEVKEYLENLDLVMVQPTVFGLADSERNWLLHVIFPLVQFVLFAYPYLHLELRLYEDNVPQKIPTLLHLAVNILVLRQSNLGYK